MLSTGEILIVLIIALVLFGPNKLPELARAVGSALGEFKIAQKSAEFDLSGFDALNRENAEKKKQEEKELHEKLVKMAEDAGFETEGKTSDELLALISLKMNQDSCKESVQDVEAGSETEQGVKAEQGAESKQSAESEQVVKAEA